MVKDIRKQILDICNPDHELFTPVGRIRIVKSKPIKKYNKLLDAFVKSNHNRVKINLNMFKDEGISVDTVQKHLQPLVESRNLILLKHQANLYLIKKPA